MIPTSEAFHEAIREDAAQIPLFIFDNCVMSSNDIVLNAGIRFSENVFSGEDFAPGQCCASTLDFQVANEDSDWNDFQYGEFTAMLGVVTNQVKTGETGCYVLAGENRITANESPPYLSFNGEEVKTVNEPVYSIVLFTNKLLAFTESGILSFSYNENGITAASFEIYSPPILKNCERWKRRRIGICYGHNIPEITTGLSGECNLTIFEKGVATAYEMVPLGVFRADRPMFSSRKIVDVSCFDRMEYFDEEYDSEKLSFPTTLYGLLEQCCNAVGVPLKTASITNGDAEITESPDFEGRTWRDIIGFIAELSGNFAKMSRYGELELRWLSEVDFSLDSHDYSEYDTAFYQAAPINSIVFRDTGKPDAVIGSKENPLYIQNNPIARAILEDWK